MEIIKDFSLLPKNSSLILGFFDGVHLGHQAVLQNCSEKTKVLITFSDSPALYFGKDFSYIYPRYYNYQIIKNFGINYIVEQDFKDLINISATEYLNSLIKSCSPKSITTGENHTFGANRSGNPFFLKNNATNYEYRCTSLSKINNEIISSSKIKEFLSIGNVEKANKFLSRNFSIESTVIEGMKLGRQLGYPTANLKYPSNIIKLPYGVYIVKVLDKPAIMNWGVKPTIGSNEIIEIHIPNFNQNLYGKTLKIEIISKIRDEIKFNNLEDLKLQIEKDVQKCLKL